MPSSRGLQGIISLFGFRGLASSPIAQSGTDSGVGVDGSEVVTEQVAGTDQGVGVDGSEGLTATLGYLSFVGELVVGVDSLKSLSATLPETDTGAGTDAHNVANTGLRGTHPDVGVGTDAVLSLTATLIDIYPGLFDAGVGTETEDLVTDRDLEVCITSIEGDLVIDITVTSEVCD